MTKQRLLTLILLVVMLVAFFHLTTFLMPESHAQEDFRFIPLLFVEASEMQNKSNYILDRAGRGLSVEKLENSRDKCLELAEKISEFRESLGEGSLAEILEKASYSYSIAAESSALSFEYSDTIAIAFNKTSQALNLVVNCDIEKSLEVWEDAKVYVEDAIEGLESILDLLVSGDSQDLFSEAHREVYDRAVNITAELLSSLREAYKVMEFVEKHKFELERLCNGDAPSQQLLHDSALLDPEKAGRFGYQIALLKSRILKSLMSNCTSSQNDGVGGGAGYNPPSSDD